MRTDTALRPIQRILVAGPPAGGRAAVEIGVHLATLTSARLRLVTVESPRNLLDRLGPGAPYQTEGATGSAAGDLARYAETRGLAPSSYETGTLHGQPRRVLLSEASDWRADLVIVGGDEDQTAPGVRLGSVTEHLIRHAACPILVISGRSPIPPQRVLFPVDLSDFSLYALACGVNFLDQIAPDPPTQADREALLVVSDGAAVDAGQRKLESWLEQHATELELLPGTSEGSPAEAIIHRARAGAFDLVVMGTHGHGSHGFSTRSIGSVTGEVLGEAPCHLLIVPPRAEFGAELAEAVVSQTEPTFDRLPSA